MKTAAFTVAALFICASSAAAQDARTPTRHEALAPIQLAQPVVTSHTGVFNGKALAYTATVEAVPVADEEGRPAATLGVISYIAEPNNPTRPVIFAFNGGPIGPSSIIHMGLLGPKRAAVPEDPRADVAAVRLVDNPYSVLDAADIVFFDPAETGFSRVAPGVDFSNSLTSVSADARELTGLIVAWTGKHGRTAAPIYLVGESYGTVRATETASQLLKLNQPPAGVILLGQAVNILEYSQRPDNIISYVVSLPTLAATGWALGKSDRKRRSFDRFMQEAEAFGDGEYLSVLFLGHRASTARREAVARKLEEFTGLASAAWLSHDLKVSKALYQRTLIPGQVLGTHDARYIGPAGKGDPFEPVLDAYQRLFEDYLKSDLKAGSVGVYSAANPYGGGFNGWYWGPNKSPFGDWRYSTSLSQVFNAQPHFRLMMGNGFYDTQTTIGAQDYLVADSDWPQERVRTHRYQGGHMAYTIEASAKAINADIRDMVLGRW